MVSGVEWLNTATNTRHVVRARHVVLAANAVQTAALLLRSSGPMAPKGLGNEKDCVGRRLSMKVSGYATGDVAYRPSSDVARTMHAGPHSTVAFSDFYLDDECPTGLGGVLYEARDDKRSRCPDDMRLRMHFLAADQPMQQNRVVLSNERDRYGIPRIVMDYRIHPIDSQRVKYLGERAVDILREAGARDVALESSEFYRGSRHLHGGCWAGNDESTSVVDKWGRVHSQENVHVVDGSYFPYAGGVNPTFTILANALRIARHLVSEMKSDVIDLVEQPEGSAL
jgi:paromamine 6'-oxidase/6'''-hydroxyneomycin C oxidase/2'-deamino-2'-hydroxyparomamine 6'-oxidase